MIDKNGKLFGKINIIDLLIILVVLALAAFVAMKFLKPVEVVPTEEVYISFFSDAEPQYVTNALNEGDNVFDAGKGLTIGTLSDFTLGQSMVIIPTAEGEVLAYERDDYNSVELVVKAQGIMGEHGVTVNGVLYGIGHSLTIYAGEAKFFLRVSNIEVAN